MYEVYENVTRAILDSVQIGDLVKTNYSNYPLKVYGVSANYFVMARLAFGNWIYSVCEKKLWTGVRHNAMRGGEFHIGRDDWVFGNPEGYHFSDPEWVKRYLEEFENGETQLSHRASVPLTRISIKRQEKPHENSLR